MFWHSQSHLSDILQSQLRSSITAEIWHLQLRPSWGLALPVEDRVRGRRWRRGRRWAARSSEKIQRPSRGRWGITWNSSTCLVKLLPYWIHLFNEEWQGQCIYIYKESVTSTCPPFRPLRTFFFLQMGECASLRSAIGSFVSRIVRHRLHRTKTIRSIQRRQTTH